MRTGVKPGTDAAKQAYFYGEGDGKRVLDVKRLAEIGGLNQETIRRNIPQWREEYGVMLQGTTESGLSLSLSGESLAKHKQDIDFFRNLADELAVEIKELPKLQAEVKKMLSWFREHGGKDDVETALSLWKMYFQTMGGRKQLITQHLAVNGRWQKASGVESLMAVAETREKTLATGRAKQALAAENPASGEDDLPDAGDKGRMRVFRRRGSTTSPVIPAEPVDVDLDEIPEPEGGWPEGLG